MRNPFGMIRLGRRELYLNWRSIAYFEPGADHEGVSIVLVTGERIEAPNWTLRKFWDSFNESRSER